MKIVFLDSVNSTQDYLKNILESQEDIPEKNYLVYTNNQTHGRGRQQNNWDHTKGSLACSFNLIPHPILTISALEIAVLICDYFKSHHNINIKLKWPNDLFYQDKKLGGIIIQIIKSQLCVGIGINHKSSKEVIDKETMRIGVDLNNFNVETFIKFIHSNRISQADLVRSRWMKLCHHTSRKVSIDNDKGLFVGLGACGEALLKVEKSTISEGIKKYISGSLRYL